MTVFKVGDKVQQSDTSDFRYGTATNPINVTGTVVEVRDHNALNVRVEWPNNCRNSYSVSDLVLVAPHFDVVMAAKQLHDLREKQSALDLEITELVEKVRKAVEGTGLVLLEDIVTKTTSLMDLVASESVEIGQQFMCNASVHPSEHVVGKSYVVIDLDPGDSMPVKLQSEDGYGWWLDLRFLPNYTLVS